jgi:hypothetical protein
MTRAGRAPHQRQICETAEYLAAVDWWGPASVLKHTRFASSSIPVSAARSPKRAVNLILRALHSMFGRRRLVQ